jgi:hypothetical protein
VHEKYSDTYNEDFLKTIFFTLSALGATVAPEALDNVNRLVEGGACPNVAVCVADCEFKPVEGGTCPSTALAEPSDGSIVMEGTFCSLTASSLTAFPTFRFDGLGFEELTLKD